MSAFAWLVSLAPLPVGSGQCLVFFPRLLFSACSFRCAWRFSRYSPQNGAEERFFDLLSRGQWGIKRSELLVRAHNWNLWNNSLTIFKAIADRENFSWRFLQSWKRQTSASWWAPFRQQEKFKCIRSCLLVFWACIGYSEEENKFWRTRIRRDL